MSLANNLVLLLTLVLPGRWQANLEIQNNKIELAISNLVNQLVNPTVYNKEVRPNFGGPPVEVIVSLMVIDINSVSEITMDLTLELVLRQLWRDSRLAYEPIGNITSMTLGASFANKIWLPNTFLRNSREVKVKHSVASQSNLIRVDHTGHVVYSTRLKTTLSCPMDLSHFPADKQRCHIDLASYDYSTDDVDYIWNEYPFEINRNITLPTFTIQGFELKREIIRYNLGAYSILTCYIDLTRSLGFYLYQIYFPAGLIVIISWIPFWLDRDHHARVGLGVTTVLTITTLTSNTMSTLPKVSYLKAIDIYLFACFFMVFLSLLEYAIVGFVDSLHQSKFKVTPSSVTSHWATSRIDNVSRVLFPIVFVAFNFIYLWYMIRVIN